MRPNVPEPVDQAIRRALAPVAADRFATAAEFAQALQVVGDRHDVAATTAVATTAPSRRRGPRRDPPARRATPPIPVAAAALVVGFLLGVGCSSPGGTRRGPPTAPAAPRVLAVLPFENLGDSRTSTSPTG